VQIVAVMYALPRPFCLQRSDHSLAGEKAGCTARLC
jgi:hypothetical protein